jgi:hypothetical protein
MCAYSCTAEQAQCIYMPKQCDVYVCPPLRTLEHTCATCVRMHALPAVHTVHNFSVYSTYIYTKLVHEYTTYLIGRDNTEQCSTCCATNKTPSFLKLMRW